MIRKLLAALAVMILLIVATVYAIKPTSAQAAAPVSYFRGINLFGAWQGGYGGTDTFATNADLDYYHSKGLDWFRVPLRWEDLQTSLNAPLDPTYIAKMDALVKAAGMRGQHISFTVINQGTYNGNNIGSLQVPVTAFVDMWSKLATHYHNNTAIYAYDLANEPWHAVNWHATAQAAINGIRAIDASKPIIAEPLDNQPFRYDSSFTGYSGGSIWYAAHIYGDVCGDPSGWGQYAKTYSTDCGSPDLMINRVKPFVDWCHATGNVCVASEYGIPGNWISGDANGVQWGTPRADQSQYNSMLDNLLTYLDANGISGNYWEAGAYGDINSASSVNSVDAPQMAVLASHPSHITYSYADDFTASFDTTKYSTCYRWACSGGWNAELERYTTNQISTHDGVLDLKAEQKGIIAHNISYAYQSGMITTADHYAYLYGVTEVRFKFPHGTGYWPAIWMLAENGQSTTELDLMENIGDNDIHSGMHWIDSAGNHKHLGTTYTVPNLSNDYHTISVDWQADHVAFALDGVEYYRETDTTHIPHTPMYLLANLAVGGTWPGNPTPSTVFPASLLIDYIHVNTATGTVITGTPTPVPTSTIAPTNTPPLPTVTPTLVPPTSTPLPVPTATIPPPTSTPLPTPTATIAPTNTPPLPTPIACVTSVIDFANYHETITICPK